VDRLFAAGYARSATFRDLVERIATADVIVHVEAVAFSGRRPDGMLRFVTRAGGIRYLRITIRVGLPREAAVALLGHELQHALEVADDASVVGPVSLEAMYRRIGEACSPHAKSYDTETARRVQRRIAAELRDHARLMAQR
jgi:hypothetical protein